MKSKKIEKNFLKASEEGEIAIIRQSISTNLNKDVRDKNGMSALMYASKYSHAKIAKLLIEAKANVNACDEDGTTVLQHAVYKADEKIVKSILDAGANVHAKDRFGNTALNYALFDYEYYDIAELLIEAGADVNTTDMHMATPLHMAAACGYHDSATLLIESNAGTLPKNCVSLSKFYSILP